MTTTRWAAALAASLSALALVSCGGGGGGADTALAAEGALRPARPGELAAYFKERIAQRSAQGMDGILSREAMDVALGQGGTVVLTATAALAGTTVQEAGVDEDDLIKSDGQRIYSLHTGGDAGPRLRTSRIQDDGSLMHVGFNSLAGEFVPQGLYLASGANRLAVLAEKAAYYYAFGDVQVAALAIAPVFSQKLALQLFDVSASQPAPAARVEIDGRVVSTRMIGNVLYVASTWTPDLSIYTVPANLPKTHVESRLANLSSSQLLPTIRVDGGNAQPLVNESECLLQPDNASLNLQLTTITAIDLASPTLARTSRCMVGDASTLYMSPTGVYFATSRDFWIASVGAQAILPLQVTTDIHKFALDGLAIAYRGSGEVAGHLGWDVEKMPYRMSEHNGDLRVIGFTGTVGWGLPQPIAGSASPPPAAPSPATLTILREDPMQGRLVKVASLPNAQRPGAIGKENEQVYAVHFAGDRGYVVTFRRTDPLYVLDLSNPADPKMAGALEVPGYSDYLYPVGEGRLLGVGRATNAAGFVQGVQLSTFDVSDPADPRLLASRTLGQQGSASALDYSRHGINILPMGNSVRIALPVGLWQSPGYQQGLARFTIDIASGSITERPMALAPAPQGWIGMERGLQAANATYYLTGGELLTVPE